MEAEFEDKHKKILLVGHAASVITLSRSLLGDDDAPIRVGCCSVTTFKRRESTDDVIKGWDLKGLAEAYFLTNGVERDWGFADIEVEAGKVVMDLGVVGTEEEIDNSEGLQIEPSQSAKM